MYSVPTDKLHKTKKADDESVRKIEYLKLNQAMHCKSNLFGQNKYINDNKHSASKILCLKKDINKIETVIEQFNHNLQLQRHEITNIKKWLTSALASGSKLRLFSIEKQGAITIFLNKLELLENWSNTNESRLLYNSKHSPCFKDNLTSTRTFQNTATQQFPHPFNETRPITESMTVEDNLESTLITASKVNQDNLSNYINQKYC